MVNFQLLEDENEKYELRKNGGGGPQLEELQINTQNLRGASRNIVTFLNFLIFLDIVE
jgi:hypothetical protein